MSISLARRVLLISVTSLAYARPTHGQEWREYRPAGAGYRVELPGRPEIKTNVVQSHAGPVSLYRVLAYVDEAAYGVVYHARPAGSIDPEEAVEDIHNGMEGILRERRRIRFGGLPASRFIKDIPARQQVSVVLAIVGPTRSYQVMYLGRAGTESLPIVKRFFDSFALVVD